MAVCGMIGMALNLLFLLNFQETFGSIYEMVGAMIAANMLGLALGALVASRLIRKYKQKTLLLAVLIVTHRCCASLAKTIGFLIACTTNSYHTFSYDIQRWIDRNDFWTCESILSSRIHQI